MPTLQGGVLVIGFLESGYIRMESSLNACDRWRRGKAKRLGGIGGEGTFKCLNIHKRCFRVELVRS